MIDTVGFFRLLADETRLRILILLTRGELCVCDIMSVIGATQSKTSRHLAYLRSAGLVQDRREGLWIHYSLAKPTGVLQQRMFEWLRHAENEVPQAVEDLRVLREIRRSRKTCAQMPISAEDKDRTYSEATKS
ncbi:MAG TPA: metalloregulator ArsR/SmtB family transcription factor [Planctomycetota bacterium]|nr:metalloregulator ArsR/SmtB family transcription factor [Planctomycetota bacterium]